MDFVTLTDRLRVAVKNPTLVDFPLANAQTYINSGYRDLASRYPFHQARRRCTFETIIGEERYQMPSDLAAILRLSNQTKGYKIWKAGDRLVADRLTDSFRAGPRRYVRYRNYVELAPTPDAIYTIEIFYLAIQAELALPQDVPVLPETWHDGIWMRAKWYYYVDAGDLAQKAAALNDYNLWLSDKPSEIDEESRDIDSGVELPERTRDFLDRRFTSFDDGYFDYRDGR